jgi:uncharacterized protein (TIGR03435 family)
MVWGRFVLMAVYLASASGQDAPELRFEVASVKRSTPGETGCVLRPSPGGERYVATCVPLRPIITTAYWIRPDQVTGGPSWVDSEPYDITGVASRPSSILDLHTMMQNLLVERFKLQLHHDTKEMPAYVLVVDKKGVKNLKSHPAGAASDLKIDQSRDGLHEKWNAQYTPMDYLVWRLSFLDRPVINQTGLQGNYDFDLAFTDEPLLEPQGKTATDSGPLDQSGPTLFEALQNQLGLKLEARKAPVDILVIDHAERPSAN